MGSNTTAASLSLFLSLALVFVSLVSACDTKTSPDVQKPSPTPAVPTPTYTYAAKCPDVIKLGVCVNVLNLVDVVVGSPPTLPCCSLIQGLVDLEAALCLCTAIRANVLGINLNVPVALSLVLNNCGKKVPTGNKVPPALLPEETKIKKNALEQICKYLLTCGPVSRAKKPEFMNKSKSTSYVKYDDHLFESIISKI
ncbi:hypothetical protein ACET3Z_006870 [Daucus carota]